ncbi:hypothetical protein MMC07_005682 [Pseudocyphellaria aurata]|nr:hypothetical protein [Pseudocyphellaria aurata]
MKSHVGIRYLILQIAWLALGGCWPMLEAEPELDLKLARDSQPMGLSTTNSTAPTHRTIVLSKIINPSLALSISLFTVATYWFLMEYTTKLSSEIVLPSKFLEDNVAAVLNGTWLRNFVEDADDIIRAYKHEWALFRIAKTDLWYAKGPDDCTFDVEPSSGTGPSIVPVKVFSPVMKSLVQIATWNSVCFWLAIVMFLNTLVYNGFCTKNILNDSWTRLTLVIVYAVTNFVYRYYAMTLLYRNFTCILYQACWTIICRDFVFVHYPEYRRKMTEEVFGKYHYRDRPAIDGSMLWTTFKFEVFGITQRSTSYELRVDRTHLDAQVGPSESPPGGQPDRTLLSYHGMRPKTNLTSSSSRYSRQK